MKTNATILVVMTIKDSVWSEKLVPIEDENIKVDFILKKPFDLSEVSILINNVFNSN